MRASTVLIAVTAVATIGMLSCCKNSRTDDPPEGERAPGALNDAPGITTVNLSDLNKHEDDGGTSTYQGKLFTGRAVERAADGSLRKEHYYVDGLVHGIVREWHDDDVSLKFEKHYVEGKAEGPAMEWDEEGNLEWVKYRGGVEIERSKEKTPK